MNSKKDTSMSQLVEIRHIRGVNTLRDCLYILTQSIKLYINIFREPPYEEDFQYSDVMDEFIKYITKGCFLVAIIDSEVVGFMCSSVGINHISADTQEKLTLEGINFQNDIYISELGVSKEHRGKKFLKN